MEKRVKKIKMTTTLKRVIKKLLSEHLNCIVWAAVGIYILVSGKTGRVQYFITWAMLIAMLWEYMPDTRQTDITNVIKKYPIGTKLKLSGDMPDDEPRTVEGYKQIGADFYLIFRDGHTACVERTAGKKRKVRRKGGCRNGKQMAGVRCSSNIHTDIGSRGSVRRKIKEENKHESTLFIRTVRNV